MFSFKVTLIDDVGAAGIIEHGDEILMVSLDRFWEPVKMRDQLEVISWMRMSAASAYAVNGVEFDTLEEATQHIRDVYVAARKARGPIPDVKLVDILDVMPSEILERYTTDSGHRPELVEVAQKELERRRREETDLD